SGWSVTPLATSVLRPPRSKAMVRLPPAPKVVSAVPSAFRRATPKSELPAPKSTSPANTILPSGWSVTPLATSVLRPPRSKGMVFLPVPWNVRSKPPESRVRSSRTRTQGRYQEQADRRFLSPRLSEETEHFIAFSLVQNLRYILGSRPL